MGDGRLRPFVARSDRRMIRSLQCALLRKRTCFSRKLGVEMTPHLGDQEAAFNPPGRGGR